LIIDEGQMLGCVLFDLLLAGLMQLDPKLNSFHLGRKKVTRKKGSQQKKRQ
jgi:hypothetical protein